jgi:NAD+ synthase (glutamine-hydrolysing)
LLRIALAQQEFPVGNITGNLSRAISCLQEARKSGAGLLLFPEMTLTGYPPEDLLLRPGFIRQTHLAVEAFTRCVEGVDAVIGHPWEENGNRYNAVSWIRDRKVIGRYFKQCLPNYAVFDEQRYFAAGHNPLVINVAGVPTAVIICEDAWEPEPALQAQDAGARLLLVPNASPYRDDKLTSRQSMFTQQSAGCGLPMVYCNLVGGQDELVFDGRSMLMNGDGSVPAPGPLCSEAVLTADFDPESSIFDNRDWPAAPTNQHEEIYTVLKRGLRDYVLRNGFTDIVLGLSGGIDSALTLVLAVDALGPERVHAVMMPSRHTSQFSLDLAVEQAELLGVDYRQVSIEPAFRTMLETLKPEFGDREADITEENLQARLRGDIIMSLSNKYNWLPLATSNKSELAVGYCTIYGDMCGGFSPIKDVLKTRVYALCEYRNSIGEAIPRGVIERPPSAELAPGQTDQDSLPEYAVLDQILIRYVDRDFSIAKIVDEGFDEDVVRRIAGLVLHSEYKRRQAAPGIRVTSRAFGRDRRYPITSGWWDSGSGGI